MAAVTTQPVKVEASVLQGNRDWTNSLFSCFSDLGTSAYVLFCGPCALCNISKRLGDHSCMPMCVPTADLVMRTRLRTLAGIRGTICNDCLTLTLCKTCAMCQMIRELDQIGL